MNATMDVVNLVFVVFCLTVILFTLRWSYHKSVILSERNLLYKEFVNNTSVKKFFKIIDSVKVKSLDSDMNIMLQKYFKKVFLKLKASNFTLLIKDIESSKHSDFIMSAFIKANMKYDLGLLGEALFDAIRSDNEEEQKILNNFLQKLFPENQAEQIKLVIEFLDRYLDRDLGDRLPFEHRKIMEVIREELKQRIKTV
jgi:hypothetical protein